jgi:hypothetical protein
MVEHPLCAVGWKAESLSNKNWGGGHIEAKNCVGRIKVDFLTGFLEAKVSETVKRR